jgi:hypothetical protein
MTHTTHTHTTAVVTLPVNGRDSRDGTATLTQIVDATGGHTVHIVTIDERAAECYGIRQPVSVIGGLVRTRGRWAPTAYRDRAHLSTVADSSTSCRTLRAEFARSARCCAGGS